MHSAEESSLAPPPGSGGFHLSPKDDAGAASSCRQVGDCGRIVRQGTGGRTRRLYDGLGKDLTMTTQAGLEKKEREFLAQCVGDAYTMLDLLPGVDPNAPALVWLADQFVILRRGECPPAHAMTL